MTPITRRVFLGTSAAATALAACGDIGETTRSSRIATHVTGTLTIPPGSLFADREVTISGNGAVIVDEGAAVSNCGFRWEAPAATQSAAVYLRRGVRVESCEFVADTAPSSPPSIVGGPPRWLIKMSGEDIELRSCLVRSEQWYGCGGVWSTGPVPDAMIIDCAFEGLHGALYLDRPDGGRVAVSRWWRCSFGNLVVSQSADDFVARDNSIVLAGNGTSGDGMTLSGLSNSRLSGNTIVAPSCYGIAINGGCDGLVVEGNTVINGITSGLYFGAAGDLGLEYRGVVVRRNQMVRNRGWQIAARNLVDAAIDENLLHLRGGAIWTTASTYSASGNVEIDDYEQSDITSPPTHGANVVGVTL